MTKYHLQNLLTVLARAWLPAAIVVAACNDGLIFPVILPDSEPHGGGDTDTDTDADTDTDTDTDTDADTVPVDSDPPCKRPYGCSLEKYCRNEDLRPGTCPKDYVCCSMPFDCPDFAKCINQATEECATGLILVDVFCDTGKVCCSPYTGNDAECGIYPENTCVQDSQTCIESDGTPNGAECPQGEVCCYHSLKK